MYPVTEYIKLQVLQICVKLQSKFYVTCLHIDTAAKCIMTSVCVCCADRLDHGPEEDHMDTITGLTTCHKLKLMASASHDGTVRVWNDTNNLIRSA